MSQYWLGKNLSYEHKYKIGRGVKQVRKADIESRICSKCGSNETYISKHGWKEWRRDGNGGWLCSNCPRRVDSNGRSITIRWLRPSHVCDICSINSNTDWHHSKGFYIIFPWFGLIELCKSCHMREKWRLGEIKNAGTKVRQMYTLGLIKRDNTTGKWIKRR